LPRPRQTTFALRVSIISAEIAKSVRQNFLPVFAKQQHRDQQLERIAYAEQLRNRTPCREAPGMTGNARTTTLP